MITVIIIGYIGLRVYAKLSSKLSINSANSFYLYDKDANLLTNGNQEWISINEMSDHLLNATLSIEDKNFYNHDGFDYLRIFKALFINLTNGKLCKELLITQQYAKNLFLDFDKNGLENGRSITYIKIRGTL